LVYIVLLDEFSLLQVVRLCRRHKDVYLLDTIPVFPLLSRLVEGVAQRLMVSGLLKHVKELGPTIEIAAMRRRLSPQDDSYRLAEPFMLKHIARDKGDAGDPDYDYAVSKQAVKHGFYYLGVARFLSELTQVGIDSVLVGGDPLITELTNGHPVRSARVWCRPFNLALSLIATGYAIWRVLSLIHLKKRKTVESFLAVDSIDNPPRQKKIVTDILDNPAKEALWVFRSRAAYDHLKDQVSDLPCYLPGDGHYSFFSGMTAVWRAVRDGLRLFLRYGGVYPSLHLSLAKLNAIRIGYEAMFNVYKIRYFWGWDEYNVEHIMRSQELRKAGGVSLGLVNGVNVFGSDVVYRFIDYDITYVFSPGPFLKYNRDNWRHPEGVRQIGATALNREEIKAMLAVPKTKDVVVFAKNYCDGAEFLDQVFKIGLALSDRNILISLKRSSIRLGGLDEFLKYINDHAPINVTLVEDLSFDLITRCRYVLSGESSIIAESIHLGSVSFFLDTYPKNDIFIYRDYEELSHRDGDEIARRIKGIEDGSWVYPVQRYAELADISGELCFDVLRRDLGLEPKDPQILKGIWSK